MLQQDTIWLAAWLEGEGWFGLTKGSIAIQALSTDLDVITHVANLMGAISVRPKKPTKFTRRQAYYCRVTGNKAKVIMEAVSPYMFERRKAKIAELLAWRASGSARRSEAIRRRWADPEYKARVSAKIAATRSNGDPKWSEAVRKGWITRHEKAKRH